MKRTAAILAIALGAAATAQADTVSVTVTGQVVFNGIGDPPLGNVGGGESVTVSFEVDSDNFTDGVPGDTRGYEIDQSSFSIAFESAKLGLLNPFPAGQTPYFGIVEGFPVSDGFFVSTSTVSPGGVPLEQEPFNLNVSLGYQGTTLDSLDILDALGTYGFGGLTSFGFNLWSVFPDNVAMEIDFEQMTIALAGPEAIGVNYCGPGVPNSTGSPGTILATGSTNADDQDLHLLASDLPPGNVCLFIASVNQGFIQPPRSCGPICLMGPDIARFKFDAQTVNSAGQCELQVDPFVVLTNPPQPILNGQTWNFQAWHRDADAGPDCNNNFTDATEVTFAP